MKPSTTVLASSARSEIRASSAGSRKEAGAVGTSDRGARCGDGGDQLGDQRLRRDLLRLRLEVEQDAMPHHGQREGAHVVERDVGTTLQQRARLGAEDERLRGANAGPVRYPIPDEARRTGLRRPTEPDEPDGEPRDLVRDGYAAYDALEGEDLFARDHGLHGVHRH